MVVMEKIIETSAMEAVFVIAIIMAVSADLIHLVSIPVTNTSVNPARSTGPALLVGGMALQQLWLFWVAPIVGGVIGGLVSKWLYDEPA